MEERDLKPELSAAEYLTAVTQWWHGLAAYRLVRSRTHSTLAPGDLYAPDQPSTGASISPTSYGVQQQRRSITDGSYDEKHVGGRDGTYSAAGQHVNSMPPTSKPANNVRVTRYRMTMRMAGYAGDAVAKAADTKSKCPGLGDESLLKHAAPLASAKTPIPHKIPSQPAAHVSS